MDLLVSTGNNLIYLSRVVYILRKLLPWMVLLPLSLSSPSNAQHQPIPTDSLVWLQQSYGWLEYWLPTNMVSFCPDGVPDSLCSTYQDSIYYLIHVDSTEIPDELFEWFEMFRVTSSIWIGTFMFQDTGMSIQIWSHPCSTDVYGEWYHIDTLYGTRQHQGVMIHIRSGIGPVQIPTWVPLPNSGTLEKNSEEVNNE